MSTLRTPVVNAQYDRANRIGRREVVVKLDCYAVLGVSPAAEDVVIRAAYLALMRAYHPDRNASAEAAARTRAVTEAYKVLGDPARRAEYDAGRRALQFEILGYDEDAEPQLWRRPPAIRWPVVGTIAASALAVVLAVALVPMTFDRGAERPTAPRTRPAAANVAASEQPRVAHAERPSAPPAPAATPNAGLGPAPALTPATAPKESTRTADEPLLVKSDAVPKPKRMAERSPIRLSRAALPKPAPVDEKARVAALESMSTSFFAQSVSHADEARRTQLQQARDLFVNARNACRSDSCVGDAHASYIRDISRIMKK